jgi:hypothetical protein
MELPIPKVKDLPTDNLYKFQGIFGLLVGIALYVSIFFFGEYVTPESKKARADNAEIVSEINLINRVYHRCDSLVNKICKEEKFLKYTDGLIIRNDSVKSEKRNQLYAFADSLEKHKVKLQVRKGILEAQLAKALYYIGAEYDIFDRGLWILLLIFCVGFLILGANGFIKWEKHSQRYQDAILMRQAGVEEDQIKIFLQRIEKDEEKRRNKPSIIKTLFGRIFSNRRNKAEEKAK